MSIVTSILLVSLGACCVNAESKAFTYDEHDVDGPYGPSHWGKISPTCNGERQSPIELHEALAIDHTNETPLEIETFYTLPDSVVAKNNGHSVSFRFKYCNGLNITLLGGPLTIHHVCDNLHFHWGEDTEGSEHTLNGYQYALEAHLVCFNSKYGSLAEAAPHSDGLAVLGFLFKLVKEDRDRVPPPFIDYLKHVVDFGSEYEDFLGAFSLEDIFKSKHGHYISYPGSLTTPGCLESVTWIVSTKPLKITKSELAEFRKLKNEEGELILRNFRPTQKLNGRVQKLY